MPTLKVPFRVNRKLSFILAITIMGIAAMTLTSCKETPAPLPTETDYQTLLTQFNPTYPGRGIADYGDNPVADIPKAYAMILMAELHRYQSQKLDAVPALATSAGKWLLTHSDENKNGVIGWGLPFEWDAYGDGSVNPANAEYTISTAIVVDSLLSWMEADQSAPRKEILATIDKALAPYLAPDCKTPLGLFPFSLQKPDYKYDTFNPSGYMAGEMQHYSQYVENPEKKRLLRQVADRVVQAVLEQKKIDPAGNWYWTYSAQENNANDMAHAGYIMEGLRTYKKYQGNLAAQVDVDKLLDHLKQFPDKKAQYVRAWPVFRKDIKNPARTYDLGMGLFLAASGPDSLGKLKDQFANATFDYKLPTGEYAKYPCQGAGVQALAAKQAPLVIQEYQAYVLYGLSYYLYK